MKRKITKLEQRLIDRGYYLLHKQYYGRKSEKTLSYMYVNKNAFVKIDSKRESVVEYGLLNYSAMELTRMEWLGIDIALNVVKNDIFGDDEPKTREPRPIEPLLNKPSDNHWEYNESEELAPMTPEQFDEL